MEFCTFASGSTGNCTLVRHNDTYILIDAGISMRRTVKSLANLGIEARQISAVLVTHEHSDHIGGLAMLVKHLSLPVFASGGTARAIVRQNRLRGHEITTFETGTPFAIGDLIVNSFNTPHDTAESVGFTIDCGGALFAYATDFGHVSSEVERSLKGADAVVLESNHDVGMLECGSYPYQIKTRILGRHGHLSNKDSGSFAARLIENGTKTVVLAHLSRDNNTPEIAYKVSEQSLTNAGIRAGRDVILAVAPADVMSAVFTV